MLWRTERLKKLSDEIWLGILPFLWLNEKNMFPFNDKVISIVVDVFIKLKN